MLRIALGHCANAAMVHRAKINRYRKQQFTSWQVHNNHVQYEVVLYNAIFINGRRRWYNFRVRSRGSEEQRPPRGWYRPGLRPVPRSPVRSFSPSVPVFRLRKISPAEHNDIFADIRTTFCCTSFNKNYSVSFVCVCVCVSTAGKATIGNSMSTESRTIQNDADHRKKNSVINYPLTRCTNTI